MKRKKNCRRFIMVYGFWLFLVAPAREFALGAAPLSPPKMSLQKIKSTSSYFISRLLDRSCSRLYDIAHSSGIRDFLGLALKPANC